MHRGLARLVLIAALLVPGARHATAKAPPEPRFYAQTVLILDNRDGRALIARQDDRVRAIASLTKLQAALVFRQRQLDLKSGTKITRTDHRVAAAGCRTRLRLKWTYRNNDLLHAMLMASDNRAVSALGQSVGLSACGLVKAMNQLAKKQLLERTKFFGPTGIDHRNVSTAREIAFIVQQAAKDPVLAKVMGKHAYYVRPLKGSRSNQYYNTNPLVGTTAKVVFSASKTGFNSAAKYCLAAVLTVNGSREFTVVLLGASTKDRRLSDITHAVQWLKRYVASEERT